jgi:hypothetical protein
VAAITLIDFAKLNVMELPPVDNEHDLENSAEQNRWRNALLSSIVLFAFASPLMAYSQNEQGSFLPLVMFGVYIVATGVMLAVLLGNLFEQHGLKKYKIGVGSMLMIMTLLALPLGLGNWLIEELTLNVQIEVSDERSRQSGMLAMKAFLILTLYFLMLPILVVTEAVLTSFIAAKQKR